MASTRERELVSQEELADHRGALVLRLDDGYRRIDQAVLNGEDVGAWEDFWIELLGQYEALSESLDRAA